MPWEWCGGEGKALWGAPALRQWEGKGTSKTDDTGTVGGPCPHTHKKRLYWAGYRETRMCQPRLLARMKHSELSWLIIEFNPTLWGIKYIQSPPCYWHAGSSWWRCMQSCQIEENWEKHKHFCTLLPAMQGLKAVLILGPDFCISQACCPQAQGDRLPGLSSWLHCCHHWSCHSRKTPGLEGLRFRHSWCPLGYELCNPLLLFLAIFFSLDLEHFRALQCVRPLSLSSSNWLSLKPTKATKKVRKKPFVNN